MIAAIRNYPFTRRRHNRFAGAVLMEMIMIIFIVAMFTAIAIVNLADILNKNNFKNRAYDLINLFQMAATSAAETGRRYEIIIDFPRNTYTLRQITTGLVAVEDILQEEIIDTGRFNEQFRAVYVMFDDGDWTDDSPALFRVGRAGWQYGGKIVLADENGKQYSIVINRLSRTVDFFEGDAGILMPRTADEMGF